MCFFSVENLLVLIGRPIYIYCNLLFVSKTGGLNSRLVL